MAMKKAFLLLGVLTFCVNNYAQVGDTVRYGDPWYGFNPVTELFTHEQFSGGVSTLSSPLLFNNQAIGNYHYEIQAYANNNYTVYGIALTTEELPPMTTDPALLLYHGVYYHVVNHPGLPVEVPSFFIHIDSIGPVDTIWMSQAPMKQCYFDYHFGYNFVTQTPTKDDSVYTGNCYEYFFDTPVTLKSGNIGGSSGATSNVDTFYLGAQYSWDTVINHNHHPLLFGYDTLLQQPWMMLLNQDYYGANAVFNFLTSGFGIPCSSIWAWGTVFPIIKLRCVEPRLRLEERGGLSATMAWQQNDTPEQYQLSITPWDIAGTDPDSGAMFYTTDTFYTFTDLQPDTRYSVWVRKACRYTTSAYDTIVWSDWSNEVVFMAVGIDEVEADGVRITGQRGSIVVEGAEGREVRVYDMLGREVNGKTKSEKGKVILAVPTAGIYMVRVGNLPTRKVAVLR